MGVNAVAQFLHWDGTISANTILTAAAFSLPIVAAIVSKANRIIERVDRADQKGVAIDGKLAALQSDVAEMKPKMETVLQLQIAQANSDEAMKEIKRRLERLEGQRV